MNKWIIAAVIAVILIGTFFYLRSNPSLLNQAGSPKPSMPPAQITNSAMLQPAGQAMEIETSEPIYYENVKGFYAQPAGNAEHPGIVMIHEWWGLNDNIKEMARALAGEGYAVLAVDLYNAPAATTAEQARKYVSVVDQEKAEANMKAAYDYLKKQQATKVASLGWCFGGGKSLAMAISGVPLAATVIYYGTPLITNQEQLTAIKWPVQGMFGDKDESIPVEKVKEFETALKAQNIANEIYIYPGVGHAFANPTGENYAPEETKDSWAKTLIFLNKNLK